MRGHKTPRRERGEWTSAGDFRPIRPEPPPRDAFVAAPDGQRERALALVTELRRAGLRAELDLGGRGLKGQMKHADRVRARHAVILDEDGTITVRDMASGEQRQVDPARVAEEIAAARASDDA
jgi:histidyl-tRNA synthetase